MKRAGRRPICPALDRAPHPPKLLLPPAPQHTHAAFPLPTPQVVVAVNRFATDTDAELEVVKAAALAAGADDAVVCRHHALGGEGATDLGRAVMEACKKPTDFRFLYPLNLTLKVGWDGCWG